MDITSPGSAAPFSVAGYRVEPSLLRVAGVATHGRLESKVMQVLVYLAQHAGQTVSRAELEQQIWPGRVVTEDTVTNAIVKLRRALGDNARRPRVIETIPKTGYRLIAEVLPLGTAAKASARRPAVGGLAGAVTATLIGLLLIATWTFLTRGEVATEQATTRSGKPAVAVLPFKNLGTSPEQDYFANGITADLITDLSKASGLLVIASGSVFAYRDSDAGPRQVSAELDADYLVVGSVQRSGDALRVNVQLIDADDERALWARRYEGPLSDIFDIQDQLTSAVISALQIELAPVEREFLAQRPTASIAAYDLYLRGLEAHGHRSREQNLIARESFQRAVGLDPAFARAYTGLAMTHSRDAIDGWVSTPSRSLEQAAALAAKAAEMDPSVPQVYFIRGQVELFRRRHLAAIAATQRALQVDPNYADAYALSAWILNYAGRSDEAQVSMDRAMRLNPRPTASYLEVLGEIRFVQRRYAESASLFTRVLSINPDYMRARLWNAAALALTGTLDAAAWEVTELMVSNPGFSLARLEFAFPFKDPRVLDALLDGLKMAGLPDA